MTVLICVSLHELSFDEPDDYNVRLAVDDDRVDLHGLCCPD